MYRIMTIFKWTAGYGEMCQMLVTLGLVGRIKAPLLAFLVLCYFPCFLHSECAHPSTPQWSFK